MSISAILEGKLTNAYIVQYNGRVLTILFKIQTRDGEYRQFTVSFSRDLFESFDTFREYVMTRLFELFSNVDISDGIKYRLYNAIRRLKPIITVFEDEWNMLEEHAYKKIRELEIEDIFVSSITHYAGGLEIKYCFTITFRDGRREKVTLTRNRLLESSIPDSLREYAMYYSYHLDEGTEELALVVLGYLHRKKPRHEIFQ